MAALIPQPPTMPVVYENLATRAFEAESQKDVLFQALRERWGVTTEVTGGTEEFSGEEFLAVKCLDCRGGGAQGDLGRFEPGSLVQDGAREFSFHVRDSQGRLERWRISASPVRARFVVQSTRDLHPGTTLSEDDTALQACFSLKDCGSSQGFSSRGEAQRARSEWKGWKVVRSLPAGTVLAQSHFTQEMIVKVNDEVKVVMSPSPLVVIRTTGRALASAPKGGHVRVELFPPGKQEPGRIRRTVDAVVVAPGEVSYVR